MNKFVCNYAIARFRPYRETGEFGIVTVPFADTEAIRRFAQV